MLTIKYESRMKRQLRLMVKRGKDPSKLVAVLDTLARGQTLPPKNRDHKLSGVLRSCRECHIEPDWLLVYKVIREELILVAISTGTHADLFGL
ncbi:MAG: type II toxin-antitoxin system YafQ family toxin [Kiritimatiellae bacterium]|nr:type II toxin-antitoxin system YafQ family toxin [Kiritimatiellia bacterium]